MPQSGKYNPPLSCSVRDEEKSSAVQSCGYNMAQKSLSHILGNSRLMKDRNYQDSGKLWAIDQRPFITEGAKLADQGFLFVPNGCMSGKKECRLHVDFHGCTNSIVLFNDTYMRSKGYLEYAVPNDIIFLFPQNNDSTSIPYEHCWMSSYQSDSEHP